MSAIADPCIFCGFASERFAKTHIDKAFTPVFICEPCCRDDADEHADDEPSALDRDRSEELLADLERDDPDFWKAMR